MDGKGGSLPSMPEPKNPASMKQLSGSPCGCKGLGDGSTDSDLLMDKAATQLAATPHEHLKDLTSRLLNGDQDKIPKFCVAPATSPILKGVEAGLQHGSSQRKSDSSPELKLKITQHLANGKSPPQSLYEANYVEEGTEEPNASLSLSEGILALDPHAGKDGSKRKRAPVKKKIPSCRRQPYGPAVIGPERSLVIHPVIEPCDKAKEYPDLVSPDVLPSVSHDALEVDTPICVTSEDLQPTLEEHTGVQGMGHVKDVIKEGQPPVQFAVGDIVWAKASGYPWWPCMITTDPDINLHFRLKASSLAGLLYHLQYFSDAPERAYVAGKNLVLFSGKEQYNNLHGNKQPGVQTDRKKLSIPRKMRMPWHTGISQATEAIDLPLEERLEKFRFIYEGGQPRFNSRMLQELQQCKQEQPQQGHEEFSDPTSLTPPDSTQSSPVTVHILSSPLPSSTNSSTSAGKMAPDTVAPKEPTSKRQCSHDDQYAPGKRKNNLVASLPQNDTVAHDKSIAAGELKPKRKYVKSGKYKKQQSLKQNMLFADINPQLKVPPKKQGTLKQKFPAAPNSLKKKKIKASASIEGLNTVLLKPIVLGVKKTSKRALGELNEADELQPSKKAKLSENYKWNRTLKAQTEPEGIKGNRKQKSKISISGDEAQVKGRYIRKRKQKSPSSKKYCTSDQLEHLCDERSYSPTDCGYEAHLNKKIERTANNKKESVCQVCEKTSEDLVTCEGQCCGSYHRECMTLDNPTDKVLCTACRTGMHICFACKKSEGVVKRCSVQHCGRFYHEACLRLSALTVFDNRGFRCPLHTCLSCHCSGRSTVKATKGKMIRCLRCPVAYHAGEQCIAAGSEILSSTTIVCTNHFNPKKGYRHHTHVNVSWCFICSNGGQLLCCESCPAAFHPDCLNITMPDGSWFCHDCRLGKKPKYRDVIWVKLGNYRWWPAEIRHPRNIPTNIQHLRHEIGEFPVYFFGSKDYYWTHQGRVFPYMEGDRASRHQRTGIGKVFKHAVQEAEARFNQIKMEREAKEAQENNKKPLPYKYIKTNKPFGRVQIYTADISEIPKCNCKPSDERPCSFESECLNRMLLYECHPQVCPAGKSCMNQDFTKRLYPETKIIRTAGKGWGLISLRDIKKGEFVNEYVGELIDEEECRARIKYAQENDITHFYMLTIDKDRIIDAGPKGNFSRFMNHSCQPNCETQKWTVNGDTRVGLFAVCDIPAGTELTFNYNLDCLGNEKTVCRCGATNCSGFLGDRPKIAIPSEPKSKAKLLKKKAKRRRARSEGKKQSEDECFRCGDGGELVLCDRKGCTKAYHLSCLDRTKRPSGRWDCPWHHCDVCGKLSDAFCQLCPNSFCKAHEEGALRPHPVNSQLCCQEHDDSDLQHSTLTSPDSGTTTKPIKRCCNTAAKSPTNTAVKKYPGKQCKVAAEA